ncbi:putative zinc-binding oxidoreductase ToxD [Cadophora sp. DSE1049]|nr:putative zinc-binding oxidoreductase ToxD [Cadophora sp. DSE1049]
MQAIQLEARGGPAVFVTTRPIPTLPPDGLLIKTVAVGLNPHELLDIDAPWSISDAGDLLGCDYAGIVEEVGSAVTRNFKKGDRVCGCTRPNPLQPDWGTFAEYIIVLGDVQLHIPDEVGFEDAASLGVSVLTAGAVLYDTLGFKMPPVGNEARRQILIYGGSTSTGRMMIQFAKLSNFEVITTSSPSNFAFLKSLGADHVFDYSLPSSPGAVNALTNSNLTLCIDCFSQQSSYEFCSAVLAKGASYVSITPMIKVDREDLVFKVCMGVLYFNAPFLIQGQKFEATKEMFESAVKFAVFAEGVLKSGEVKCHPSEVRVGGLQWVLGGIQEMREGKVAGKKLVYRVAK